jgi:hypothetical protein
MGWIFRGADAIVKADSPTDSMSDNGYYVKYNWPLIIKLPEPIQGVVGFLLQKTMFPASYIL